MGGPTADSQLTTATKPCPQNTCRMYRRQEECHCVVMADSIVARQSYIDCIPVNTCLPPGSPSISVDLDRRMTAALASSGLRMRARAHFHMSESSRPYAARSDAQAGSCSGRPRQATAPKASLNYLFSLSTVSAPVTRVEAFHSPLPFHVSLHLSHMSLVRSTTLVARDTHPGAFWTETISIVGRCRAGIGLERPPESQQVEAQTRDAGHTSNPEPTLRPVSHIASR